MIILAIVSAGTIVGPIAIWILSIALGDYFAYKYNQRLLAQTNFMKDVVDTVGKTDDKQEGINDIESETIISEDEDEFKIVFQAKDSNSWKNIKTKLMKIFVFRCYINSNLFPLGFNCLQEEKFIPNGKKYGFIYAATSSQASHP